jgi:hypothetical protein
MEEFFIPAFLVTGLAIVIWFWRDFWKNVGQLVHFFVLGLVLVLATAAAQTGMEVTLGENFTTSAINFFMILRNTLLAAAGLTLFKREGSLKPLRPWDESLRVVHEIPIGNAISLLIGFTSYSIILLKWLAPHILEVKSQGTSAFLSSASLGLLTAVHEELVFRLFIIGVVVFLARAWKYRWEFAIVVSSVLWSYSHWFVADLGWIKFIQIFPLGLYLGYMLKRFGFEACVLMHLMANIVVMFTAQML